MKVGGRPGAPLFAAVRYDSSPGFFVCMNGLPFGLSWLVSFAYSRYKAWHWFGLGFYRTCPEPGLHCWTLSGWTPLFHFQLDRWLAVFVR